MIFQKIACSCYAPTGFWHMIWMKDSFHTSNLVAFDFDTEVRNIIRLNSDPANCDFCRLLITFANSLDPGQARHNGLTL